MNAVERQVTSGDASLFVRRAGGDAARATLLAVHGGPGLSHEPLELLEAIAGPDLAVVTYDQRAVGRSTGGLSAPPFEQAVQDLAAVDAALDPPRLHLLGHSWGGLLAALYAAAHPQRVASLTLVDSIPPTSTDLAAAMQRQRARLAEFQARGLVPAELPGWDDPTSRLLAMQPAYFVDPRHPAARTLGGTRPSEAANRAGAAALSSYDVRAQMARIVCPTLHVIAPVPFGVEMGGAMADAITAAPARRVVLTDAGHLPWLETPTAFLDLLRRFLDETTIKGDRS